MATSSETMSLPSRLVFSDVHKDRPCTECHLCKETYSTYTHPVKWKSQSLLTFLRDLEPDLIIEPDTCICRNCRNSLSSGQSDQENFQARWRKSRSGIMATCEVPNCGQPACRSTKLVTRGDLSNILNCSPVPSSELTDSTQTRLCDQHYRTVHRELHPGTYQWKCAVCSAVLKGSNHRTCSEPQSFQQHLHDHTDFVETLTASTRVCMACYRYSLTVAGLSKENILTNDDDFQCLVEQVQKSVPLLPFTITQDSELIDIAVKLTVINVAKELRGDRALTLLSAYSQFLRNINILLPTSTLASSPENLSSHRWLLGQLSSFLKHHMSYTCIVKKHGIILYRQGRELQALSHAIFSSSSSTKTSFSAQPDHVQVCNSISNKIHDLIATTRSITTPMALDIDEMIQSIDHVLWETVCLLTQSHSDRANKPEHSLIKNTRRLFILHQIMFCIDSKCSMPFHVLNADLIDCFGGASELVKIFNRLGVCVSMDTLSRHIQSTVEQISAKGLLQGLNPSLLTMFTVDNIDFLHKHARVFCGNQHLDSHATTVQAVQTKPSLNKTSITDDQQLDPLVSPAKRSHALLSPTNSPDRLGKTPTAKRVRCRARTGTEFQHEQATEEEVTRSYDFHSLADATCSLNEPERKLCIFDFRQSNGEKKATNTFLHKAVSYYLIKDVYHGNLGTLKTFFATSTNAPKPEVGNVKYIHVLDEVADSKDTMLHVISDLYSEYICGHENKFLVLEGDAKTYDIIQAIKYEYGSDIDWLIPFPGDWHLLKNYQLCLMKPFFDAGLRELSVASGYPALSVQGCKNFKRTHHFLMETWESLFRHMLRHYLAQRQSTDTLNRRLDSALEELQKINQEDHMASYCVFRSIQEEMEELKLLTDFHTYIQAMSELDDTWKFWARFVFEDCLPYIGLYLAIRSENWELRMSSLKSMAADFTAFDHPHYQKLISQHVSDVFHMPQVLLEYLEKGGFALSISGRTLNSVGLDECHEMLINRHVKEAVVRPSADYINRIAKYIPTRINYIDHLKTQLFGVQSVQESHLFSPDSGELKSAANIQSLISKIEAGKLLPASVMCNRGLINPFRALTANEAQRHDLLNFHQIGLDAYEARIKAYTLNIPSVKVPMHRKRMHTFSTTQKKKTQKVASLQLEMKRVQKCMRRKIAFANRTGMKADVVGEQYIELPRALCDPNGIPVKGQKSMVTQFYQARYKDADLILHTSPANFIPDSVILEGMFLINTKPLKSHKTMADYSTFLMRRFLSPYFHKGCKEVHLLFDNPGRQAANPKLFEQQRRDAIITGDHICIVNFTKESEVPRKWQQLLNCRKCKRALTMFLSSYILDNIAPLLQGNQKFVTSGATDPDHPVEVTRGTGKCPSPLFESIADESDTRIWLHAKHSAGANKFILSPDTDVYHIGLPLVTPNLRIVVQLSRPSDRELKLLDVNLLLDLLERDPDLVDIPHPDIPHIVQSLFVATGCDYVSFFTGIGKSYFFKVFFENAKFILGTEGAFTTEYTHCNLHHQSQRSQLAFTRLVGCSYFKKHTNAFYGHTPSSLFNSFAGGDSEYQQHCQWLDHIRQTIWDRISFESEMIPSITALQSHWLRSCWVLHLWQQAQSANMVLAPLHGNGWIEGKDKKLEVFWDTEENMLKVKQTVQLLLKGCGCKSGCRTSRCGCKKNSRTCGPGCRCSDCENTEQNRDDPENSIIRMERETNTLDQCDDNCTMESVFGTDSDDGESEDHNSDDEPDPEDWLS